LNLNPGRGRRVLLVDDNKWLVDAVMRLLEWEGYSCLAAENGTQGVLLAELHRPDIAVLDYDLPDTDGVAIAQRLFDNACRPGTVIMISGNDIPALPELLAARVIDHFMRKPVSPDALLAQMQQAVLPA
jgi:CheY-like chemotaxis protein